jgi:hypothetical protein
MREMSKAYTFPVLKPGGDHLGEVGVDRMITLKQILRIQSGML